MRELFLNINSNRQLNANFPKSDNVITTSGCVVHPTLIQYIHHTLGIGRLYDKIPLMNQSTGCNNGVITLCICPSNEDMEIECMICGLTCPCSMIVDIHVCKVIFQDDQSMHPSNYMDS